MKFDSKTLRLIMIGSLVLLSVGFLATAFLGLSALSKKSQSLVQLKSESQDTDTRLNNLEQAKKEVAKYSYFKDVAKTVIPSEKNQAETVLEIYQMAQQSGISIQSITFPASTLGQAVGAPPPGAKTDAASATTQTTLTQAKPVSGIPGLYSLELTITPSAGKDVPAAQQVTFPKMLDFLKRIENNRHTAQITQVGIQPASDNQTLSFTLTINIFIKP
jgi:hypothetical protein